jgi:hypothetical protein
MSHPPELQGNKRQERERRLEGVGLPRQT